MTEVQILQEEFENAYRERVKANAIIGGTIDNLLNAAKYRIQKDIEGFWKNGVYYLLRGITTRKSTECGWVDATLIQLGWRLESLKHKIHAVENVRIYLKINDLLNENFLLHVLDKVQSKCK